MGRPLMNNFSLMFLAGRTIENAVKDAIRQRYSVIATGSILTASGGPRLENAGNGVVLADMQLYCGVRAGWVEVKSKSQAMHFRKWDRREHGIDRDKALQYWKLQQDTGQTVYLLICEAETGDILMQSLATLFSQGNFRKGFDTSSHKWMINWDRRMFARVGAFSVPTDDLRMISVQIDWDEFETFVTQPILIEDYQ